jgi:hypothetical protein
MKNLMRAAAVAVASTALVAGGATVATAAPSAPSVASTSVVATSGDVSIAAAPYAPDPRSKIRIQKRGSKLKFRLTARYLDDAYNPVGIRKATIQVLKGKKWKTLKNVKLNSNGGGSYKTSSSKKRKYRMLVKPTSLYQGFRTVSVKI